MLSSPPTSAATPADAAELLAAQLPRVYRSAEYVGRRNGLAPEEIEDFRGWVLDYLTTGDYAVIRRFRGESSLSTYLTVVVASQLRDFRAARHGRWRPSAEAKRIGPPAPRLEQLVLRQAMPLAEAGELLRTRGETGLSDVELARLLDRLPERGPMRPIGVGSEALGALADPSAPDALLELAEARAERARILEVLQAAMAELSAEDRAIVRMRFWEGASVQAVARALGLEPKPLYRRLERICGRLRGRLEDANIHSDGVLDLLGEP